MYKGYDKTLHRELEICDDCVLDDSYDERFTGCKPAGDGVEVGEHCQVPGCGAYRDARPGSPLYRPHLFSLTEAKDDFSAAHGASETAIASVKIVGKTFANFGVIVAKSGFQILKRMPAHAHSRMEAQLKRKDLTEEQRELGEASLQRMKDRQSSVD